MKVKIIGSIILMIVVILIFSVSNGTTVNVNQNGNGTSVDVNQSGNSSLYTSGTSATQNSSGTTVSVNQNGNTTSVYTGGTSTVQNSNGQQVATSVSSSTAKSNPETGIEDYTIPGIICISVLALIVYIRYRKIK